MKFQFNIKMENDLTSFFFSWIDFKTMAGLSHHSADINEIVAQMTN